MSVKTMVIREICARSILSESKVYDYTINAYGGCQHACTYCYARFMKRFSGHLEPWGKYVDVKINAPDLLQKEVIKKTPGRVWISGVCDPYQPVEKKYELTQKCLKILIEQCWPVTIQTRSPLVLRDKEILKKSAKVEVGISITTADESIRRIFEPGTPPIAERIKVLHELHSAGIKTFVMIAPMLPGAEKLMSILPGKVDFVRIDRLNYHYADWVYVKYNLKNYLNDSFFFKTSKSLCDSLIKQGIDCDIIG
jgi:DNA repair photolyase